MKYLFVPGAISAVAESIGGTATGGAVIYGLDADWVNVSESADALLQRLSLASSFVKLTRPDGSPVWINSKSVSVVRQPLPDDLEYAPQVHSVIFAGTLKQALCESLDQVRQALGRVGVNL
ncbi:MAG TPA: hypothetical protein VGT07_16670 [Steroidobacteraceae bacterium]|nr:hypothetical protein [Steroidobacteraceae bacterium]